MEFAIYKIKDFRENKDFKIKDLSFPCKLILSEPIDRGGDNLITEFIVREPKAAVMFVLGDYAEKPGSALRFALKEWLNTSLDIVDSIGISDAGFLQEVLNFFALKSGLY